MHYVLTPCWYYSKATRCRQLNYYYSAGCPHYCCDLKSWSRYIADYAVERHVFASTIIINYVGDRPGAIFFGSFVRRGCSDLDITMTQFSSYLFFFIENGTRAFENIYIYKYKIII